MYDIQVSKCNDGTYGIEGYINGSDGNAIEVSSWASDIYYDSIEELASDILATCKAQGIEVNDKLELAINLDEYMREVDPVTHELGMLDYDEDVSSIDAQIDALETAHTYVIEYLQELIDSDMLDSDETARAQGLISDVLNTCN